jgi:hypothetical protein
VSANGKVQKMVVQITLEVPTVTTDVGREAQRVALRDAAEKGFLPLGKEMGMYLNNILMKREE